MSAATGDFDYDVRILQWLTFVDNQIDRTSLYILKLGLHERNSTWKNGKSEPTFQPLSCTEEFAGRKESFAKIPLCLKKVQE